jgi:hypothetical protein
MVPEQNTVLKQKTIRLRHQHFEDILRKTLQRMALALTLTFLERYHKDGDEILNQIIRVTNDEPRFNL